DKILDVPLAKVGGKGLFTKEIEESLLRNETDLAVHSLKDVPTVVPNGLKVEVITERENPYDVLVSRGVKFLDLPPGAKVGTSSLRRRSQIKRVRPDLVIVDIRGNVQTRLKKLETENLDAIILAAAGMIRMGYQDEITEYLDESLVLPAVGQGAVAIETRVNDPKVEEIVQRLHHLPTAYCTIAERAFLRKLEGGCQVPIAAFGKVDGDTLSLEGLVADLDGQRIIRETISGSVSDAVSIGERLGDLLLEQGAKEILDEVFGNNEES
ncbi:MAG: hydroxymethylbilane synthase, partial [Nitrospinota bacterium]|nr:hydroxymethylbilane synthase [Nitrospinota bacterium]